MADEEANDEIYVVDRILKHHKKRNRPGLKYLIRWKDYSSDNDTWEDEENILDPEIIENYWKTRGGEEERILQSAVGTNKPHMVLGHEKKQGGTGFRYFMRWKGHPTRSDSWIDEELLDSKYIDEYWEKRGGKQQGNSKSTPESDPRSGKRKLDMKEAPNRKMSRRGSNSDEPLLMLDITHNSRNKHRQKVKQQTPTNKSISTPPSSSSSSPPQSAASKPPSILKQQTPPSKSLSIPPSSSPPPILKKQPSTINSKSTPSSSSSAASKQPAQLKSILKKRITKKDLASISSDLSTFDFDALTLSPTPPSSTKQPSSSSLSSTHPQQVPSVSFSEPLHDPTPSSSRQTPEPEALVPRVKRTVEFLTPTSTAAVSRTNDTGHHHHAPSFFPPSLNQSIQQHADRTLQSDLFKGQEIIFDLDFRSELSYDWESEIKCVETVMKNGASLYAIVRWKDNALAMYPTQLIQRRCHMKLIAFYERILEV